MLTNILLIIILIVLCVLTSKISKLLYLSETHLISTIKIRKKLNDAEYTPTRPATDRDLDEERKI